MATTQTSTITQALNTAIQNRRHVQFTYMGHHRVVQPAVLGVHTDLCTPVLRGYQVGGETSPATDVPDWGLFLVFKIRDLHITADPIVFDPPGSEEDQTTISSIIAHL